MQGVILPRGRRPYLVLFAMLLLAAVCCSCTSVMFALGMYDHLNVVDAVVSNDGASVEFTIPELGDRTPVLIQDIRVLKLQANKLDRNSELLWEIKLDNKVSSDLKYNRFPIKYCESRSGIVYIVPCHNLEKGSYILDGSVLVSGYQYSECPDTPFVAYTFSTKFSVDENGKVGSGLR
jgi:hypothetical protein